MSYNDQMYGGYDDYDDSHYDPDQMKRVSASESDRLHDNDQLGESGGKNKDVEYGGGQGGDDGDVVMSSAGPFGSNEGLPEYDNNDEDAFAGSSRRNIPQFIVGSLLLTGIISMATSHGKHNNKSTVLPPPPSTNDDDGGAHVTTTVVLVPPPDNLKDICSPTLLASSDAGGMGDCEDACWLSDCCDFPLEFDLSCLKGQETECQLYHASCSILDAPDPAAAAAEQQQNNEKNIPMAPFDLPTSCSSESLRTIDGFAACRQACHPAQCCWDGISCYHTAGEEVCEGYAPCLALASSDAVHQDITAEVESKCGKSNLGSLLGRTQCREVCSHALCCFYDEGCSHLSNAEEFCAQYAKCNALESHTAVAASKDEIDAACSKNVDTGDPNGHESMCELLCEVGACCFADDEQTSNCDLLDPNIQCKNYASCEHLYGGGSSGGGGLNNGDGKNTDDNDGGMDTPSESATRDQVEAACTGSVRLTELAKCEEACMPAACCFEEDAVDDQKCLVNCDLYDACEGTVFDADDDADADADADDNNENLIGNDDTGAGDGEIFPSKQSDVTKAQVDERCRDYQQDAAFGGTTHTISPCEEVCVFAHCCFDENWDCPEVVICSKYDACSVLYGNGKTTTSTSTPTADSGDEKYPDFHVEVVSKDQVDAACDPDPEVELMREPNGKTLCQDFCETGACCFAQGSERCTDDEEFCSKFAACDQDNDGDIDGSDADNNGWQGGDIGNNSNNDGVNDVSSNNDEIGSGGDDGASNLGLSETDVTKEEIDAACKSGDGSGILCSQLCHFGTCCFAGSGVGPCDAAFDCSKYASCEKSAGGGDSSSNSLPEEDITRAAVDAACNSGGTDISLCDDLCSYGMCCLNDHDNCPVDCVKYVACGFPVEEKPITKRFVDNACRDAFNENPSEEDITKCDTACLPGDCCYTEDIECDESIDCEVFSACWVEDDESGDVVDEQENESGTSFVDEEYVDNEQQKESPIKTFIDEECTGDGKGPAFVSVKCESYCRDIKCCYADIEEEMCDAVGRTDVYCPDYVSCSVIFDKEMTFVASDGGRRNRE